MERAALEVVASEEFTALSGRPVRDNMSILTGRNGASQVDTDASPVIYTPRRPAPTAHSLANDDNRLARRPVSPLPALESLSGFL